MTKTNSDSKQIQVGLGTGFIPVTIEGLSFKLLTSDKKRKEYREVLSKLELEQKKIIDKAKKMQKNQDLSKEFDVYDQSVKLIKHAVDTVLGDEAFDQLYEKAGEDVEAIMTAFAEVMNQYRLIQEKSKLQKIISGKKK